MLYLKNPNHNLKHFIVIPIISTLIIPLVVLDIWVEIYHRICFPLCKIPYVKRKEYIKIDRHKLKYLTWLQKIYCAYCAYCGYGNGLINYCAKIAGETERYWCGIRHQENSNFNAPDHHKNFVRYNDKSDFEEKYKK